MKSAPGRLQGGARVLWSLDSPEQVQAESSLGCSLQACTQVSRVINFSFQNSFQLHTLAKSQQGSSVGAEFVGDSVMRNEGLTVLEERRSPQWRNLERPQLDPAS